MVDQLIMRSETLEPASRLRLQDAGEGCAEQDGMSRPEPTGAPAGGGLPQDRQTALRPCQPFQS